MQKITVVLGGLIWLLSSALLHAETRFKIDPVHSGVVFRVKHLGVAHVWGRFNEPAGTVIWDEQDPSKSRIEVTLQAAKVDTGNQGRDAHLRKADFFNAPQFPTITFKSTSIVAEAENRYKLSGDLTMHGVTRSITVPLEKVGEGDRGERFGYRAGFDANFTVKRSDFGITYMPDGIGDDVEVFVSLEVTRA